MQYREETRHKRSSFAHLTLILLLQYLVKCRSRSLDVNNNKFILGIACWLRVIVQTSATYRLLSSAVIMQH